MVAATVVLHFEGHWLQTAIIPRPLFKMRSSGLVKLSLRTRGRHFIGVDVHRRYSSMRRVCVPAWLAGWNASISRGGGRCALCVSFLCSPLPSSVHNARHQRPAAAAQRHQDRSAGLLLQQLHAARSQRPLEHAAGRQLQSVVLLLFALFFSFFFFTFLSSFTVFFFFFFFAVFAVFAVFAAKASALLPCFINHFLNCLIPFSCEDMFVTTFVNEQEKGIQILLFRSNARDSSVGACK